MRREPGQIKRSPRVDVRHEGVLIDSDGVESDVIVTDISSEGCRLRTDGTPMIGEKVRLRVGRMGDYPGQIRWALGEEAGMIFTGPVEQLGE
ncbi:MAG: PilZ domain-containing protein [Erythrobacter sp.]|nr:PilZ domain-containing protein [Erythrobacter sp.]